MLEVREITKKFGDLVANDKVDFTIGEGEIHALLGENGAGKSTLVKMLYGSLQPNGGEIIWKGHPVNITSPSEARHTGIGMVFQHFSLFDSLSVADNIALSLDGEFTSSEIAEKAQELSHSYGLPLNPASIVGDLSVGERQRVEIVRCLLQNPDLIILDEPTSVLTPQEADNLFVTLERLKSEGRSILYISHRLDEVRRLCDRATVLRHGKVVGECDPSKETASSLANMMVGSEVEGITRQTGNAKGDEKLLELKDISLVAATPFAMSLKNLSLEIYAGQLLGIAGVAGNGQSELFDLISGEVTIPDNDKITMRGQSVGSLDINDRRKLGAAFVPEERLGHSAVPDLTLSENLLLARHASDNHDYTALGRIQVILRDALMRTTKRISQVMDVRKSGDNPAASSLSGGNLQKFIMGRELDRQPSIMVVNQPTWGVDAGAATRVRQALIDLARSGSCVAVISQDLDEIFEISDIISVMSDGHLSEPMDAKDMTREEIGLLMGGMADDLAGVVNAH
ncbi:MAG: ABC transporter ATP-binding protein [Rhizobiaceae bacterium]|nr:ABC transporter ATP-binding protein [Rhizobiaceae bacterium]